MSESSVTESIKEVVQDRLTNPLWGYIILSWCGFNWQNLAILFMSNSAVNVRIGQIMSDERFYSHSLILPVIVGCFLAIISPYLRLCLSVLHGLANKMQRASEKENLLGIYDFRIETANKKADAEYADQIANAAKQLELSQKEQEIEQGKLQTQSLKAEETELKDKVTALQTEVSNLKGERVALIEQMEKLTDLVVQLEDVMYDASTGFNNESDFKSKVNRLVHPSLLEEAKTRHEEFLSTIPF